MIAIMFFCFILIPMYRIKSDLYDIIVGSVFAKSERGHLDDETSMMDLPMTQFRDLRERRHRSIDSTCFLCLEEYKAEDAVSQLGKCGHVYHMSCIERWLRRNHYYCPFCRSSLFTAPAPAIDSCK